MRRGSRFAADGGSVRARWSHRLRDSPLLDTAFAIEAVADELTFVVGPAWLLGALLAVSGFATAPTFIASVSVVQTSVPAVRLTEALGWSAPASPPGWPRAPRSTVVQEPAGPCAR